MCASLCNSNRINTLFVPSFTTRLGFSVPTSESSAALLHRHESEFDVVSECHIASDTGDTLKSDVWITSERGLDLHHMPKATICAVSLSKLSFEQIQEMVFLFIPIIIESVIDAVNATVALRAQSTTAKENMKIDKTQVNKEHSFAKLKKDTEHLKKKKKKDAQGENTTKHSAAGINHQ